MELAGGKGRGQQGKRNWQEEYLVNEVNRGVCSRKCTLFSMTGAVFGGEDGIEGTLIRKRSWWIYI